MIYDSIERSFMLFINDFLKVYRLNLNNLLGLYKMAAYDNHPCFPQPDSEGISLWKYMDFTKFISLITYQKIFLCRSDLFDDPFEGTFPRKIIEYVHGIHSGDIDETIAKFIKSVYKFNKFARQHTYISCWHANDFESAAMWELYSKNDASVAIETTYADLKKLLPLDAMIGMVKYIDYDSDTFPLDNTFYPFTHKRKSFEHEREVRFLIQKIPYNSEGDEVNFQEMVSPNVIPVDVDVSSFVKKIHLSPRAPEWMLTLLQDVVKKYSIDVEVRRSNLYLSPVY